MKKLIPLMILITAGAAHAAPVKESDAPATPASIQSSRPIIDQHITLQDAVAIALRESPVVRGAAEEVNMSLARVQMAKAGSRHTLSATTTLTGGGMSSLYSTPSPVMPQNISSAPRGRFFDQNLALMLPVYTGGRLQALIRQARAARSASAADLQAVMRDLALEAKTAYRQVLLAQAVADIYQTLVNTAEERLRIDREAQTAGRIPMYYVLRDEAEAANAQQMLVNARRDVELAFVSLKTVLGISQASRITLSDNLSYERAQYSKSELLTLAEKQRPELEAARQRLQGAREEVDVARSAYAPQVSLAAMADTMRGGGMSPFTGATLGVVVGLPILDGGMRRARISEARANQRRLQQGVELAALQIIEEVEGALLSIQAAEHNIKTAETALASAEENYRVAQLRYTAGRGINVEVLDSLAALIRARTNRVQALYDYNTARDQLLRAIGQQ